MSKKYIRQQILQDFVFPNNEVSQYDVDNIVHDINDNSVSGTVTNFSASTVTTTSISFSYTFSWSRNGADIFRQIGSTSTILSIHMLVPNQSYYKPWRCVGFFNTVATGNTVTGTTSFTVSSVDEFGLSSFPNGVYYFEFRFIGKKSIYPVCASLNISQPSPTPTPTQTSTTTPTPTPTITPSQATPTPTPTPSPTVDSGGGGTLYVYAKYINSSDELGYELNGGPYLGIGTVPTTSCDFLATITGLTNGDSIVFSTLLNKAISGDPSDCPVSAGSCTYTHTFTGTGSNFVYITIDGMNNC